MFSGGRIARPIAATSTRSAVPAHAPWADDALGRRTAGSSLFLFGAVGFTGGVICRATTNDLRTQTGHTVRLFGPPPPAPTASRAIRHFGRWIGPPTGDVVRAWDR